MKYTYLLLLPGLALAACTPVNSQPAASNSPVPTSSTLTALASPLISPVGSSAQGNGACLPPGIELSSVVSAQATSESKVNKVTVQQTLDQLGASCQNGLLVDSSGKEIYFYSLKGCWGNPPDNYQDILQKQRDELEKMKTQYNVIEMTCDPSGIPIP